jgi:predicted small secreted protein
MKTIVLVIVCFFVVVLTASCNTSPVVQGVYDDTASVNQSKGISSTSADQNTTQIITGTIQSVTPSNTLGSFVVAIKSDNRTQNVTVSKNTSVAIQGQACTLDEVNLFDLQGTSYNCTVVINPCDGKATQFDVVKVFP